MIPTEPSVRLIARPALDYGEIESYLHEVGGADWIERVYNDSVGREAQDLVEFAGRTCYRSWSPGLNPNVTRIRREQEEYLVNILQSEHGSVLEHANFSFLFTNVSRVFTHELVRHRVGTAISQESLRFVRLDEISFWFPEWAQQDAELMSRANALLAQMEAFQLWMADHFALNEPGTKFHEKKHKTSFMRRFAPEGVSTAIVWTANIRTLRNTIEMRTSAGAEEEIRLVFGKVGEIIRDEVPVLFSDFSVKDGEWTPSWRKV